MTLPFHKTFTDKDGKEHLIKDLVLRPETVKYLSQPGYYADSKLKGFFLKITETGRKIYVVRKKPKGASEKVTITLGEHGVPLLVFDPRTQKLKPGSAREKAEECIGMMTLGQNPTELRKKQQQEELEAKKVEDERRAREELTVRDAFEKYLATKTLKQSTISAYRYDFEKRLKDWLDRPIFEITDIEVEDRHKEISKKHPGQANGTFAFFYPNAIRNWHEQIVWV